MKKNRLICPFLSILIVLLLIITLIHYFQINNKNLKDPPRLNIVATTGMIGDALHNIVQDKATITTLMGPGVDPHSYRSTARDGKELEKAALIFCNGLNLEGQMQSVFESLGQIKPVYLVSDGLCKTDIQQDPNFSAGQDPHIWGDVRLWKKVIIYISTKLQEKDPTNATLYKKNTEAYLKKLETLHQSIHQAIQKTPPSLRLLITDLDDFRYFGNAYGLEIKALRGFVKESEAGLKNRIHLKNLIIERNIKTIFLEATISSAPIKALVESCQMEGHQVHTRILYSDTLGEKGTPAGTYIGMMQENLQHIVKGLTKNDTTH